jgi:hypothetical protein
VDYLPPIEFRGIVDDSFQILHYLSLGEERPVFFVQDVEPVCKQKREA